MAKTIKTREHPLIAYLETLLEGYTLLSISEYLEQQNVAELNKKKRALYRSTIISICAAFETYLEAVIEDALSCLVQNASKSTQIPINVLLRISSRLKTTDERLIWKISDDGWKNELIVNFQLLKEKFNTPRPHNIDDFVFQTLGIKKISSTWKWQGQSATNSNKKLNDFMELRGDITHRLTTDKNVYAHMLTDYVNFLYRISSIISNDIREHVHSLVNKYPWQFYEPKRLIR